MDYLVLFSSYNFVWGISGLIRAIIQTIRGLTCRVNHNVHKNHELRFRFLELLHYFGDQGSPQHHKRWACRLGISLWQGQPPRCVCFWHFFGIGRLIIYLLILLIALITLYLYYIQDISANEVKPKKISLSVVSSILEVSPNDWDACTLDATPPENYNPFLTHAFLSSLEESGCAVKVVTYYFKLHLYKL